MGRPCQMLAKAPVYDGLDGDLGGGDGGPGEFGVAGGGTIGNGAITDLGGIGAGVEGLALDGDREKKLVVLVWKAAADEDITQGAAGLVDAEAELDPGGTVSDDLGVGDVAEIGVVDA